MRLVSTLTLAGCAAVWAMSTKYEFYIHRAHNRMECSFSNGGIFFSLTTAEPHPTCGRNEVNPAATSNSFYFGPCRQAMYSWDQRCGLRLSCDLRISAGDLY